MSKCYGCYPFYNFCQFAHMGVGGCQERYDSTYKNDSFKTSKYMSEINEYINDSLNKYSKNIRESSVSTINIDIENFENVIEINECSVCYETIGEKNCCVTECGHKFCLKCILLSMDRSNKCPICRHALKDDNRDLTTRDLLVNEVDLNVWIDSLPNAGVNLNEDDLDYVINTFSNYYPDNF